MRDKVSVIIPVYNVEPFLSKCIESVINQSYEKIEIILVDDGSIDNSGRICDEYSNKDSRIKVIHKQNGGVSETRNVGIEAATGKYVCFIDADDYVMNDYVSHLLELVTKNKSEIGITTGFFSDFNLKQNQSNFEIWDAEKATVMILCYRTLIGANSKIFNRNFLINNNIKFSTELTIGEGFNFNTAAFQRASKIAVSHRKIYFYRKDNPTSVTTIYNDKKWQNGIYALEKINNDFIIKTSKVARAWRYAYWRTCTDAYDLLIIARAKNKYPITYKKITKNIRKGFFYSLNLPVTIKDKTRALIMMVNPKIIPWLMELRRRKYNIKIEKKEG